MNSVSRWLIGIGVAGAGFGAFPALASTRPILDSIVSYVACLAVAAAVVALLWISTLGIRR